MEPKFQLSTKEEIKKIKLFMKKNFGFSELKLFENYVFYTKAGKIKEIYLVPTHLVQYLNEMKLNAYCAGIPFGTIWKNEFQLEIEGAKLLLPYTDKIIQVKTEQFLYGKSIYIENVKKIFGNFKKGDYIIIIGKNNLHYGLGKILYNSEELSSLKPNTVIIKGHKNKPFDRGWYLRRGG